VDVIHDLNGRGTDDILFRNVVRNRGMAEFENPYAEEDPLVQAHFDCLNCEGKLWEYAIQRQMVCEDCRTVFSTDEIFDAQT